MTIESPEIQQTDTASAALIHLTISRDEMQKEFPRAIHEILDALREQELAPAGPPFARHFRYDPETFDLDVGFPVGGDPRTQGRVKAGELPAARVIRTVHHGAYEGLPDAWREFAAWVKAEDVDVRDEFRERYVVGPESSTNPEDWRTELSWVLR